jgi:Glycosyl hydrolase family 12
VANNVSVNFTSVLTATDPLGVGLVITEFANGLSGGQAPILGSAAWLNLLKELAPGHMRCSIAYYGGNPSYGAGGSPGEQGSGGSVAAALISAIKSTGAIPLVSFNGNSNDNNFIPADGGSLVHFFNDNGGQNGGPVQYWSIGNEPEFSGNTWNTSTYQATSGQGSAPATLTAMLAADSVINVGIPAAGDWDTGLLEWAAGVAGIKGLSYHAYDALDAPGSDNGGGGFYETGQYYTQTGTMRSLKSGLIYGVEEFNANASAGSGTTIAFTTSWQETCWIADVLGQLLSSGAHGTVYGDSNDGLSIISDGSNGLPGIGTPMPAYWGLGIWTGMNGQFSRYSGNMVSATTTFPNTSVSVYASDNGKIVLINKSTTAQALTIGLTLAGGGTSGTYTAWATNFGSPTSAITQVVGSTAFTGGVIDYTIPGGTCVSIDVTTQTSTLTQTGGNADEQFLTADVGPYLFQLNEWNSTQAYSCEYTYTPGSGEAMPNGIPGNWALSFDDEFTGPTLNTANWTIETGTANNVVDSASNVIMLNPGLALQLANSDSGAQLVATSYTLPVGSCIEARIWFPGPGAPTPGNAIYNWPAWWVSGPNWPSAGEIDIAEGYNGTLTNNYHSPSGAHNGPSPGPAGNWSNSWHTYGMIRNPTSFDIYFDGALVYTYSPTDDDGAPQNVLLTMGAGNTAAYGTASYMMVSYVRAWAPTTTNNEALTVGFSVISSSLAVSTSGAPASYSSIVSGNHAVGTPNYVSPTSTQFPIKNSAITAGEVTTSVAGSVPGSGAWDYAYDIWFSSTANPTTGVGNNGSGLEMMIWLNHLGGIQPAGAAQAAVTINGVSYTPWVATDGPISYVMNTLVTSVTDLDLLPFIDDAISRGLMTSSWYLIDVECGFEIWNGGVGLTISDFSCSNAGTGPTPPPVPPPTPPPPIPFIPGLTSVPGLSVPGKTSPGTPLFSSGGSAITISAPLIRMSLAGTVSAPGAIISPVQSNTGFTWGTTEIIVTLPAGVTLGNLVVVCITAHGSGLTVTPPSGWAQAGSGNSLSGTLQTQIFYLVVGSGQVGETSFAFVYSSSVTQAATIREWNSTTGWKASPVDKTTTNSAFGSGTISSGSSGTTTQGTELAVGALSWGNSGQAESALTAGYTSGNLADSSGSCSIREVYQVLSVPGAQAVQETVSGSQNTIGFLATFEPSYHYIETLIAYTSVEANPANGIRKGMTAAASVLSQALRTIPRHISVSFAVTPKAFKGFGRVLKGLVSSGGKDTAVDIGYTEYGPLHIVFPGGGKTVGGLNPMVFNSPRVSLHAVFAFAKSLPRIKTTLAGKVYYGVLKVLLPNPSTALAGKDTHNVLRAVAAAPEVPLSGRITRQGALSIALSSRQMGFLYRDVLAPEDLTPARWLTGQAGKQWKSGIPETGWNAMGYGTVQISHLSTEYVLVPIAATRSGVSYNPTSDVVQFAFMPNAVQQPGLSDWVGGSWDTDTTNILYPYSAKCLVGPSGVIALLPGAYVIFVKIEDSPETPVLTAGQLTVN